jgi:hypothetical protein
MTSVILFMVCALVNNPKPQRTTIRMPCVSCIYEVTFDSSQLSPAEVKRWMQLSPEISPYNDYQLPERLESCFLDDPRYQGCGKEQVRVNFHNAQLNLAKIRHRIRDLNPKRYPADLSEVVLYLRAIQSFGLHAGTQRLAFARTGDVSALESEFDRINPKLVCGTVLERIRSATSEAETSSLSRRDWSNCVWSAEIKRIGDYPTKAWEKFLAAHGIREHYVEEFPAD